METSKEINIRVLDRALDVNIPEAVYDQLAQQLEVERDG